MVSSKHCKVILCLVAALFTFGSSAYDGSNDVILSEDDDSNEDIWALRSLNIDDEGEYEMTSRDISEEYEDDENIQNYDDEELEAQSFSRRGGTEEDWFKTTIKSIPPIVVHFKVNADKDSEVDERAIKNGRSKKKAVIEKDTFIVDPKQNILVDSIQRRDGKELTILDYKTGVMAVLTPLDKMCRLHEIPDEAKNVSLVEEKEELKTLSKLSKDGKVVEVTEKDKDKVDYKQASKDVKKEDVGAKIFQICSSKKYKIVWMEQFENKTEKREYTDQFSNGDELADNFLDEDDENRLVSVGEVDKRGCTYTKVWQCTPACTTRYIRKSYCCRRACRPNTRCVRTCYKNTKSRLCCKNKCGYYYHRQSYCCKRGCTPNAGKCTRTCYKKVAKRTCRKCCRNVRKRCCY